MIATSNNPTGIPLRLEKSKVLSGIKVENLEPEKILHPVFRNGTLRFLPSQRKTGSLYLC